MGVLILDEGFMVSKKMRSLYFILLMTFCLQDAMSANVDIGGGRHLYLKCAGSGTPTVILESGFRNNSDVWTVSTDKKPSIFSSISAVTRVCVYDRPGTIGWTVNAKSRSDVIAMPRSINSMTEDLHALLKAGNIKGPYILVGHSFGGILIRLYASKYPDEVIGMILIDAYPESLRSFLGKEKWDVTLKMMETIPEGINDKSHFENIDFDQASTVMEETASHSPLKSMPLIVISRGKAADLSVPESALSSNDFEKAWRLGQQQLVSLEPDATHIIANKSQHYVQYAQPELIIQSIKKMIKQVKTDSINH